MGSLYSKALASTAIIGIAWIGVSAVLAGGLLLASGKWLAAAALIALGIPLLVSGYMWLRRAVPGAAERRRLAALIVAVELFAVGASAARLVLILIGLGVDASLDQTLVLAVSSCSRRRPESCPVASGCASSSRPSWLLSWGYLRLRVLRRRRSTA